MKPLSKLCAFLSVSVPILFVIVELAFGKSLSSPALDAIVAFCIVPVAASGIWLWFSEDAGNYLNGFASLRDDDRRRAANLLGFGLTASAFVMSLGLGILLSNGGMYGILVILLSMVFVFIPYASLNDNRIHDVRIPFESRSPAFKNIMAITVSLAVLVPMSAFASSDSNEMAVVFDENSFVIKAPSFDREFRYDDVNELTLDEDFDKGRRMFGYGSSEISSGKFSNSSFGNYYLTSYTKVKPCITFSVDGTMYAFNQADTEKTQQAYYTLHSKIASIA